MALGLAAFRLSQIAVKEIGPLDRPHSYNFSYSMAMTNNCQLESFLLQGRALISEGKMDA